MNKTEVIDGFCKVLMNNNVSEHDIEHFKINARKYKLKKNENFKLKDTHALNNKGNIYQIWSTMNKGHFEYEYICSVSGPNSKKLFVF